MVNVQVKLSDREVAIVETIAKKQGITVDEMLARVTRDIIAQHKENKQ
jgi:predicted transcriptional regulator